MPLMIQVYIMLRDRLILIEHIKNNYLNKNINLAGLLLYFFKEKHIKKIKSNKCSSLQRRYDILFFYDILITASFIY